MVWQSPQGPLIPGLNKQLNKLHNIPLIGPWTGRIGKVNRIMGFPCHPTPEIWVEAFVVAGAHAIMSVFSPTCIDFLVARAHQTGDNKGRGGGRHGGGTGGGPGKTKKPKFQLDPYKMFQFPNLPVPGQVGLYALRSIEIARFIGFWITIIDATTQGLVNWTSLAYQWQGCLQPGGTGAQAHAEPGDVILFSNAWLNFTGWRWDQHNHVSTHGGGFTAVRGNQVNISWSLSAHRPPEVPSCTGDITFRMANTTTNEVQEGRTVLTGVSGQQAQHNVFFNTAGYPFDCSIVIQYYMADCGLGIIDSGHLTYTSAPLTDMYKPTEPCPALHGR